jgi:hypothetical protein
LHTAPATGKTFYAAQAPAAGPASTLVFSEPYCLKKSKQLLKPVWTITFFCTIYMLADLSKAASFCVIFHKWSYLKWLSETEQRIGTVPAPASPNEAA